MTNITLYYAVLDHQEQCVLDTTVTRSSLGFGVWKCACGIGSYQAQLRITGSNAINLQNTNRYLTVYFRKLLVSSVPRHWAC